jgi:uncharacterized protein YjbI with pentapeptide repeats
MTPRRERCYRPDLRNAEFHGADLKDADFAGARVESTRSNVPF